MRIANIGGRSALIIEAPGGIRAVDIEQFTGGAFSSNTRELIGELEALAAWLKDKDPAAASSPVSLKDLETPISEPRQIFAIGLNYAAHAAEVSIESSDVPTVFTKYISSLTGADTEVVLPSDAVDWEVELVAVIGKGGRNISREDAYSHIAGYAVGQDLSCRELQFASKSSPQFSIGKSYEGFTPVGPWITSADEVADPGSLNMNCGVEDEVLQEGTTANLLFDIPAIIEHLSSVVELLPGDLIFTGTPDGVGFGRSPQRYLRAGETLTSEIEGLGRIRQTFV